MPRLKPQLQSQPPAAPENQLTKVLHSVEEAAEILSVGRTTIFALIKGAQIFAVRIGKRRLIAARELEAFASRLQQSEGLGIPCKPKSCFPPEDDPTRSTHDRETWREAKGRSK